MKSLLKHRERIWLEEKYPGFTLYLRVLEVVGIYPSRSESGTFSFLVPDDFPGLEHAEWKEIGFANTAIQLFERQLHLLRLDTLRVCQWVLDTVMSRYKTRTRSLQVLIDHNTDSMTWLVAVESSEGEGVFSAEAPTLEECLYQSAVGIAEYYEQADAPGTEEDT